MKSVEKEPVFSVITVVYNGIDEIERTVLSCTSQDYANYEYIVIDGGSSDGTQDILYANQDLIKHLICKPDKGIYDAMNKGLNLATGDYVLFMNCSDRFHHTNVLSQLAEVLKIENSWPDVLYGDALYIYPMVKLLTKPKPLASMDREMALNHQSTLVRTVLAKKHPFNLKYRLAADYDMMHTFFRQGCTFKYIPICIADCNQEEGSTFNNYRLSTKERFSIQNDHGSLKNWILLQKTLLRMEFVFFIKRLIPKKSTSAIFNRRHNDRITY